MALRLSLVITADGKIAEAEIRKITGELDKLGRGGRGAGGDASAGLRQAGDAARGFGGEARSIIAQVGALRASIVGLAGAFALREVVDANLQLGRTRNTLLAVSGTAVAAAGDLAFVRQEAHRLGLDVSRTSQDFAGLAASAKGTALEGRGIREVFRGVAEAATVLNLSSEASGRTLNALQQIASKGTVQMEELRQQLGDHIPGALNIAARAMGKTTAEFVALVEAGQVAAEDFLPRFAAELSRTFSAGLPAAVNSAQASINRFKTAVFDAFTTFGDAGFMRAFQQSVDALTRSLSGGGALQSALIALGTATALAADNFGLLAGAAAGFLALRLGGSLQTGTTRLLETAQAAGTARASTLALAQAEAAAAVQRLRNLEAARAAIVVERQLALQRLATANAQFARGIASGTDQRAAINDLARLGAQGAAVNAVLPGAAIAVTRTTEAVTAAERANGAFGKLLAGAASVVNFLGGPWVVGFLAAGAAIGYLLTRETEADRARRTHGESIQRILDLRQRETQATREQAAAIETETRAAAEAARARAEASLAEARRAAVAAQAAAANAARLDRLRGIDQGPAAYRGAELDVERTRRAVLDAVAAIQELRAASGEFDALIAEDVRAFALLGTQAAASEAAIGRAELAIRKFREEIDPSIEASRKLAQAQADLNILVRAGRYSQEEANQILDRARRHYRDAVDPIGAYIDRLRDESDTLRLVGVDRERALAQLELEKKLLRELTDAERSRINAAVDGRAEIRAQQQVRDAQVEQSFAQEAARAGNSRAAQARVDARRQTYEFMRQNLPEGQRLADEFRAGGVPPAGPASDFYNARLGAGLADAGASAADFVRNAEAAIRANERLAEAQSRGVAAIRDAEIANRAEQEALRGSGVARERLIALIAQEEDSRRRLGVATAVAELDREIAGLERIAAAQQQGAAAVREANTQNRVAAELVRLRVEAGSAEAASIEQRIRSQEALNQTIANAEVLRARREELETAQLELSLAGETEEARGRILEVFRTELDLRRRGIDLASEQARAELALADQIGRTRGALQEVNRERELWTEPLKNAVKGIQDAFTDMFRSIFSGGVRSFRDFGNAVLNVFTNLAAQIASLLIFRPVISGVLGSVGLEGLARDLVGGGGGGAGGVSLGNLGNLFSGGGFGTLTPGLDNWAFRNFGFGAVPSFTGASPGLLGGGSIFGGFQSFGNLLGIAGAGLPGALSGNWAQAGLGLGGAAIGTAILPGIGTAIGGLLGNVLGGLFGGKKPAYTTSYANFNSSATGYGYGWGETYGRSLDAPRSVGDAFATAFNQFLQAIGGTVAGGPSRLSFGAGGTGSQAEYSLRSVNAAGQVDYTRIHLTAEQAVREALTYVIGNSQFAGVGAAVQGALRNTRGQDIESILAAVEAAKTFQQQYDILIKPPEQASAFKQQIDELTKTFDAAKKTAQSYGLSVAALDQGLAARKAQLKTDMQEQYRLAALDYTDPVAAALARLQKEKEAAIKDAQLVGASIVDIEKYYGFKRLEILESQQKAMTSVLREWLDAQELSPASSLSPEQRLAEAQSQFTAIIAQVRGGQAGVGAALQAAESLLNEARSFYASGEGFGAIERTIRETLMSVGHQLGIPGFAAGGYPPVGRRVRVGERGPEDAVFLSPVRIYSAEQTRQMARAERDTLTPALSAFPGGADAAARVFAEGMRRMLDVLRSIDARLGAMARGSSLAAAAPGALR